MIVYEAADLAPDTYIGEYFQPSVKVYKKNDADEEIKKKDELLKEMAEALDGLLYRTDGITFQEKWDVGARVLQKYREQEATNAK